MFGRATSPNRTSRFKTLPQSCRHRSLFSHSAQQRRHGAVGAQGRESTTSTIRRSARRLATIRNCSAVAPPIAKKAARHSTAGTVDLPPWLTFTECLSGSVYSSNPKANKIASRISSITPAGILPTNDRSPAFGTVTKLSRLIAEVVFRPHSVPITTSVGMPRIVVVIGATVTL